MTRPVIFTGIDDLMYLLKNSQGSGRWIGIGVGTVVGVSTINITCEDTLTCHFLFPFYDLPFGLCHPPFYPLPPSPPPSSLLQWGGPGGGMVSTRRQASVGRRDMCASIVASHSDHGSTKSPSAVVVVVPAADGNEGLPCAISGDW